MATVSELRARRDAKVCYLLGIEGIPYMWTTDSEIAGTAWIGQDDPTKEVRAGLVMPRSVTIASDKQTGNLVKGGSVNIRLEDYADDLIAGLLSVDASSISQVAAPQVMPGDDPAPATVFNGAIDVPTPGKWIGEEAIGPAGERRFWPLFPDQVLPGLDHFAAPLDYDEGTPIGIAEAPFAWEGRRVALWRIFRDDDGPFAGAAAWPRWSDQHAGGALLWWGKIKAGISSRGRLWTIPCSGPESWLHKLLNVNSTTRWIRVASTLRLAGEERLIWVAFRKTLFGGIEVLNGRVVGDSVFDEFPTSIDQVVDKIRTAVDTARNQVGPGDNSGYDPHAYVTEQTGPNPGDQIAPAGYGDLSATGEKFTAQIDNLGANNGRVEGSMYLILHEKILRTLGFDPYIQGTQDALNFITEANVFRAIKLQAGQQLLWNNAPTSMPTSLYWSITFSTRSLESEPQVIDNDGVAREFARLTPPTVLIDTTLPSRLLLDAQAEDPLFWEGQLGRPPTGGADFVVDRTGYVAIRGPFAQEVSDANGESSVEREQRTMVAKVSYRDDLGQVAIESAPSRTLWLEKFIGQPRLWGIDSEAVPPNTIWAALEPFTDDPEAEQDQNVFRLTRLAAWTYLDDAASKEKTHALLCRILLSTGTASWPGGADEENPGDGPNGGVNEPAGADEYGDREIADLGLGIPYQLVDVDSFKAADAALEPKLRNIKLANHGPVQSRELINDLLGAGGFSIGLRGSRYTLFRFYDDPDIDDVEAVLDESTFHNDTAPVGRGFADVGDAPVWPIDKLEVSYFRDPLAGSTQRSKSFRARDLLTRVRPGLRDRSVNAAFLGHDPTKDKEVWEGLFSLLWQQQIARWHARPNRLLRGVKVTRLAGQDLYPGAVVRITNRWPANASGGYGWIDHLAWVIKVTHGTSLQPLDATVTLDLLVGPKSLTEQRFFAPMARVIDDATASEQRYDPGALTFKCYKDGFQASSPISDVKGFEEPAWSGAGGDALIWGYQYDGHNWQQTFSGNVVSVDETTDTITLTGPIVGTFYERMYTVLVLAPHDEPGQAPWVQQRYLVNTKPDGTFGGGPTQGWKLEQ